MQDSMRLGKRVFYPFVALFLLFWCVTITAGLAGGACRQAAIETAKRLIYCNLSITVGAPIRAIDVAGRGGLVYGERALVHAMLGDDLAARADLGRALYLTEGTSFRDNLVRRIAAARNDPEMHPALDLLGLLQESN